MYETPCLLSPTISRKPSLFLEPFSMMGTEILRSHRLQITIRRFIYHVNPPTSADFVSDLVSGLLHSLAGAQLFLCYRPIWQGDIGGSDPLSGAQEANSRCDLGPTAASAPGIPLWGLAIQERGSIHLQLMQIQLHVCTQPKREKESKSKLNNAYCSTRPWAAVGIK